MMRKTILVAAMAVVGLGVSWGWGQVASGGAGSDRCVVMISIDGLAGFYWGDPKAEMPNIRRLAAMGAKGPGMRSVMPSVTWPNHTSLVTGEMPAKHGVVGNNYLDRKSGQPVQLIGDPVFNQDEIVKVPTVYDLAHQAGLTTAAITWPASRGAKTLTWTTPDAGGNLLDEYSTAEVKAMAEEAGIWPKMSAATRPVRAALSEGQQVKLFNLILEKKKPNLGLLHIFHVDHVQHEFGPRAPEVYEAIKEADAHVGEVWEAMQRVYPGKATLFVVSDHGFSRIEHAILPNVVLREAGLLEVKGLRVTGGDVRVVTQGGCGFVYILNEEKRAEIAQKVKGLFEKVEGVETVVLPEGYKKYGVADPKEDPHAPDVMLLAKMGYTFGATAAGMISQLEKPESKGTHGHDVYYPDLQATFVAAGAGVKAGVTVEGIRNVDVAPTMGRVLGVEMRGVEGRVMEEMLVK